MKKLNILFVLLTLALVSCKKEPQPIINNYNCSVDDMDSTYIEIVLIDFIITDFGTNFDTPNNNHFSSNVYALSKFNGQVLDSVPLNLFGNDLDTINLTNTSNANFSFCCMLPNQVDKLKINKNTTILEVWDNTTKIGSVNVGRYGFYGIVESPTNEYLVNKDPILDYRIYVRI